jgi:site-specific DNA recombinase
LQAIADQANERAVFLRLAETLAAFLARLHGAADTLSIIERQRIVRLVVKDVLIGDDTITIRHSIPISQGAPQGGCPPPSQVYGLNYLLCKGSEFALAKQYRARRTRLRTGAPGTPTRPLRR